VSKGSWEVDPVFEAFLERNFIPGEEIQRTQMVGHRQRIQLVQARHHIVVFDVCESADMQYELRSPSPGRQLIADPLDVPRCKP